MPQIQAWGPGREGGAGKFHYLQAMAYSDDLCVETVAKDQGPGQMSSCAVCVGHMSARSHHERMSTAAFQACLISPTTRESGLEVM